MILHRRISKRRTARWPRCPMWVFFYCRCLIVPPNLLCWVVWCRFYHFFASAIRFSFTVHSFQARSIFTIWSDHDLPNPHRFPQLPLPFPFSGACSCQGIAKVISPCWVVSSLSWFYMLFILVLPFFFIVPTFFFDLLRLVFGWWSIRWASLLHQSLSVSWT